MNKHLCFVVFLLVVLVFSGGCSDDVATPVAVTFSGLIANGASATATTTELTLDFDADPATLTAGDITITGATKGTLGGSGTTRTLTVSALTVTNGASISVTIANPAGFTITPATRNVTVYVKHYAIGDIGPSGVGKVFYITDGGAHGLEAAPEDMTNENAYCWSDVTTQFIGSLGPLPAEIGSGAANTAAIVSASGVITAARRCQEYTGGGMTDWFLPALDELSELYAQRAVFGNFDTKWYWSSSEGSSSLYARIVHMGTGAVDIYTKGSNTALARPVRAF